MNYLKKILRLRSMRKNATEQKQSAEAPKKIVAEASVVDEDVWSAQVLMHLPHNVVHPGDLLNPLCMAVGMKTFNAATASIADIKLYSLYDLADAQFLGSFYGIQREGLYYGNIVGSPQIFCCKPNAFRFVETDSLSVPLRNDGKNLFILMCEYNHQKTKVVACYLKKTDMKVENEVVLHEFAKGTSFTKAYSYWEKQFA